jgi:hypothetical protein
MQVTSTLTISPSFKTVSSGIPWHITLFIDVHTLLESHHIPVVPDMH